MPFAPLRPVGDGHATVTGFGTQADPWVITLSGATTDASSKLPELAHHYDVQGLRWQARAQGTDSRCSSASTGSPIAKAEYLYDQEGSPVLIQKQMRLRRWSTNQVQLVALNLLEDNAMLWYGYEGIAVERGMTRPNCRSA